MKAVLLATHSWAWTLTDDARLSRRARASIEQAKAVLVSPISFFEIGQQVRLGKWPEMEALIDRLPAILDEQGGAVAALDPTVCTTAGTMRWAHQSLRSAACGDGAALQPADRVGGRRSRRLGGSALVVIPSSASLRHHGISLRR